jgi:hypothetical protein
MLAVKPVDGRVASRPTGKGVAALPTGKKRPYVRGDCPESFTSFRTGSVKGSRRGEETGL